MSAAWPSHLGDRGILEAQPAAAATVGGSVASCMKVIHTHAMSKRMQVLFEEEEMEQMRQCAGQQAMTLSDWVRRALRDAVRRTPAAQSDHKLEAIRAATAHEFPTADIDQMLDEIKRGYGAS